MSTQEFYNLLTLSATDGTFPSFDPQSNKCFLRLDKTPHCKQRCVVGLLMPDEKYEEHYDNYGFSLSFKTIDIPEGFSINKILDLLSKHDNMARHQWNSYTFIQFLNEYPNFKNCIKVSLPHAYLCQFCGKIYDPVKCLSTLPDQFCDKTCHYGYVSKFNRLPPITKEIPAEGESHDSI